MVQSHTIPISIHVVMVNSHKAQAIYAVALKPTIQVSIVVRMAFCHHFHPYTIVAVKATIQINTHVARVS